MDEIDNDQAFNEKLLETFIANARGRKSVTPSLHFCDACGEPLPEKRRQLLPGVRLCVDCQLSTEKARR